MSTITECDRCRVQTDGTMWRVACDETWEFDLCDKCVELIEDAIINPPAAARMRRVREDGA